MNKQKSAAALLAAFTFVFCFASAARAAPDGLSFEAGRGNERTDLWRIGLQWKWGKRWLERGAWRLDAYWDLQLGQWSGASHTSFGENTVTDLSLTPVFRYERTSANGYGIAPYVEAGIGFHLLSDLQVSRQRLFSTRFQFGDHVGVGARFGARLQNDVGLRLQHLSNGGINRPNPGINFLQLRYQYHFD